MQRISLGKGCHFKSTAIHEVSFMCQKQPPEVFYKKAILKNFTIFTKKNL